MDFRPYASPHGAILLDLDGTIYHEDHALPGAAALVRRLAKEGYSYACLTNSTLSPRRVRSRLLQMGIDVPEARIYTAAAAAADYVLSLAGDGTGAPDGTHREGNSLPRAFNLATESLEELLEERVQWVDSAIAAAAHTARPGQKPCDVVVVGAPTNVFATEERQRAALAFLRGGALLLGMCADRVYPSPRGIEFGSGALTHMLAYAANVRPVFTGKPEPVFFRELCARLGVAPERCMLVGDNLESDIAGAKAMGMHTVLTLTGVARREDLRDLPMSQRPDTIVETLEEL